MYNTYSSSIISIRTSFSVNERCSSTSCSCCYSFPISSSRFIVPINPSFLYGLRQSTLIQLPSSRRLILAPSDRYCYRSPIYDLGQCCCGKSCCIKQEGIDSLQGKICKEKSFLKEKSVNGNKIRGRLATRNYRYNALGDAEAMLSLLTEENDEECLNVRERKTSSSKEGKVVRKQNVVSEKSEGRKENFENLQVESSRIQSREEGRNRREEGKALLKDEVQRLRRRESSSSYYSFSDSDDSESDIVVEINNEGLVGESLINHGKDSKKMGRIKICEGTKKEPKSYTDARDEQRSTHDDLRVASSSEWDWRKKSEKKLTQESAEETKSIKDSVVRESQLSRAHERNSTKISSSKEQFNYQDEASTSDVNFRRKSRSHVKTENRGSEYAQSKTVREQEARTNGEGKGVLVVGKSDSEIGFDCCKTCGQAVQQNQTRDDFQQHAELSEVHDDARWTSAAQDYSRSRLRKEENSSTLLRASKEEIKRHDQMVDARRRTQHYTETVDTKDNYVESTLRSQKQSETRMKNFEENSSSLISSQKMKGVQEESGGKVIKESESSRASQAGKSTSQVHSTNIQINQQFASDQRIYNEQTYLTSEVKSVDELVNKNKQRDKTIVRSGLRTEVQGPITQGGFTGNFSGVATIDQPSVTLVSQTGGQRVSEGEVKSDLQLSKTSPSYQSVDVRSKYGELSSSYVRNASGRITEVGTSSVYIHPQTTTPFSSDEVHGSGSNSHEEPSVQGSMGSGDHMKQSSTQIIGEFVEKTSLEASTSETRVEKKLSQLDSKHQNEKYTLKVTTQSSSEKTSPEKQDSSHSSGGSTTKGPSDEMWDVKDHFVQEPSEMESPEVLTSENVVVKRSGKSFWNLLSGIFRLRSETQKSPTKVGGQSSSNGSAGGETWFSGNDPDDANGASKTSTPQEPIRSRKEDFGVTILDDKFGNVDVGGSSSSSVLLGVSIGENTNWNRTQQISQSTPSLDLSLPPSRKLRRSNSFKEVEEGGQNEGLISSKEEPIRSRKEDFGVMILDDKLGHVDVGSSSSSSVLHGSLVSGGVFLGENTNWNITQQMTQSTPSLDFSAPPPRRLRRSNSFKEIEEGGQNEGVVSSTEEQVENSIDVTQTGVTASEVTDVELRQRRIQRSKQVVQERFDEWEDAYKRESKQRKIDEIFMREALVEAMKAADSWEVPIGAVLVQNGKIIARGYNLVEELRDSTAHAEMICIREASKVLQTWRLSETTLYVTLEPCPMCAGAILQARIGTLVWGAPNKLLGADGSWIRLFRDGEEVEPRQEVSDKPAAPVHPFHPKMRIRRGILEAECAEIMQQFFQLRRKKEMKKKSEEPSQPSCLPVPHHPSKLLHKMHDIFHIMFCL